MFKKVSDTGVTHWLIDGSYISIGHKTHHRSNIPFDDNKGESVIKSKCCYSFFKFS